MYKLSRMFSEERLEFFIRLVSKDDNDIDSI